MALSLMRLLVSAFLVVLVLGSLVTVFATYAPSTYSAQNATCGAACFSNISINTSQTFQNNTYNPFVKTTSKSLNLSNNLTAASSTFGFSFPFVLSNVGNDAASIVQAPKTLGNFLAAAIGNLGIVIGGSTSLTQTIVTGIMGLIGLYIFLLFLSLWMKYPVV